MKLLQAVRKNKAVEEEKPVSLVTQFQEWLVSEDRFKADPWRNQGARFYPSGFGYDCDRSMALKFCKAPTSPTDRDPRLEIIFKIGDGIHDQLQSLFEKFAKHRGWLFESEVRIKPDENPWFVSGRVDGILVQPLGPRRKGIEIKSINDRDFNALHKAPKREHIEQGNCYVGLKNLNEMHYIYVNKDKSTLKEFIQPPNEALFRESMSRLEHIVLTMQGNRFPVCANCTKRCEFHRINREQPDLMVEDIADAPVKKAIEDFKPTYVRARRKAR